MAHFHLGGSVSVDATFQSSFAKELVKESSISCNESVYKSSFATELLESVHNNSDVEKNIYENVDTPVDSNPFLDDTPDFRRSSQIFNSTMVGSSPRESLSSISRVQTVLSITGHNSLNILDTSQPQTERSDLDNFNKLQIELQLLQTKLNDMEKSRITYETTNQQLLSLINKLSSQLSRNVKISQHKTNSTTGTEQTREQTAANSNSGLSSSFRRQKGIRIKKRDSVRRRVSVKGDAASYTSSDSGNYSDGDDSNNLNRLLRKGLHLVNNVNQELESAQTRDKHLENTETLRSSLSSSISRVKNSKKVLIKIEHRAGHGQLDGDKVVLMEEQESSAPARSQSGVHTNVGSVLVPVPFYV